MGIVSSRLEDGPAIYLKDQSRLSISSLTISNGRRKVVLNVTPNSFPATRLIARRPQGDDTPITYIQDPESTALSFLPSLDLEDELDFNFVFVARQPNTAPAPHASPTNTSAADTSIAGLTFAYASNQRDLDTLVTREFHADPNLHKNSNVQLIGDLATKGSPTAEFEWNWRWKPPKASEDKGGGWRNICSVLEYDSRAHRLNTLASFGFWVYNNAAIPPPPLASPTFELAVPTPRQRVSSNQSYQSTMSDSESAAELLIPESPLVSTGEFAVSTSTIAAASTAPPVVDVLCQRPGEDMSAVEDGPVFRATMKSLEQKTGNMRIQIKKVLKRAEAAQQAQVECNQSMKGFLDALQEASASNASAFKPALDHYFNKIATQLLQYETANASLLQKQIIDPLSKLYTMDIKQAESKKKDFEDESRDYYAYVSRYLGQRQDSMKDKKRIEVDTKYQNKKRNFELKRFDYSSFMQDLHGGRKEQELLSQLTTYADRQAKSFRSTARKVETLTPQLDALVHGVTEADKEYNLQRTEREEKRRHLEKNTSTDTEPISHVTSNPSAISGPNGQIGYSSDTDLSRADSSSSQFKPGKTLSPSNSVLNRSTNGALSTSPGNTSLVPTPNKFKGIRDLEERDIASGNSLDRSSTGPYRKEGLLWALSKPGSHIDPKGINKQAWHKFWIVLDQGKLSEYSNWKDKLDLHREPIDLRVASVRMARDAERRFCFEVITPHFKRVYQATTEEEMNYWISAINNALQGAVEGRGSISIPMSYRNDQGGREYGAALTGKTSSQSGPHGQVPRSDPSSIGRRITVGARPSYMRTSSNSYGHDPSKLLDQIRNNDQGNMYCADCNSTSKVEWVSLNLAIVVCIECGGIHRSLGTHVTKLRSLTLDINSFTCDIVELLLLVGNRISNMIWEATLDRNLKPEPSATREQRLKFITSKYVERSYLEPSSQFSSPDDTLLMSIKKHDIQGVLSGIAHRANVNAHDRSRNTHAVFLALAAADPAMQQQIGIGSSSMSTTTQGATAMNVSASSASSTPATKAFPMAELLVQNGAEIPNESAPIPLSPAAQLYIEQRTAKAIHRHPSQTAAMTLQMGNGKHNAGSDTLGPLPNVSGRGIVTMGGGDSASSAILVPSGSGLGLAHSNSVGSGSMSLSSATAKLQKRGSAGARFAGKVAGLGERTER